MAPLGGRHTGFLPLRPLEPLHVGDEAGPTGHAAKTVIMRCVGFSGSTEKSHSQVTTSMVQAIFKCMQVLGIG
jgi:hypothetical protein